ncbi:P-type conjugative transfer protein TrbG [Caulobacter sp. 602-2]|uniref:P-type conjugative transfer protein TrbG n=1 Tax=Caulobacter sp. 602-2 TaxID=2710887 RepID=A0A6G4QUX1_9CAUL|nr:P-type conjugative transfer protein TrbG [Caulobacter sp. 602-2]NGM49283.1 P-type conjugative transfer protein TrbG [Caulobacter sp. 602-2]
MNRLLILSAGAVLSACSHADRVPPPKVAFDPAEFQEAKVIPEPPAPVVVVETPKPLPLPGQLLPAPSVRLEVASPAARVSAANKAAIREPTSAGYVNAVQVYPWSEGALYRLYAAPQHVTDIALEAGEQLVAVSSGDTVRWTIGDTTSGAGEGRRVHVLVKPFASGLSTNMVIATDRRAYHLALVSTDATAMAALSWTYPQDQLVSLRRQAAESAVAQASGPVAVDQLRFRYAIAGDSPAWRPIRVFDDSRKVYIEFPARLDQGEAPPLFVVGPLGEHQLVNYRVQGNRYIVDRLFAAAELRMGDKPQQVVRIVRTDTEGGGARR